MTFEETRDNTIDIEANLSEADAREDTEGIRRSKPFMDDTPEPEGMPEDDPTDPEHDPIGDAETDYDIEFDEDREVRWKPPNEHE